MADEPQRGPKPFPSAKDGASDDDIFAEMGRMLAHDQLNMPAKPATRPFPPPAASAPPAAPKPTAARVADEPLELTQVIKPGKPQAAPPAQPTPAQPTPAQPTVAAPAPAVPKPATPPPAAPASAMPASAAGTTVGQAAALLNDKPKATETTVSTRSLDSIVEGVARDMIREWLDRNMERIAREEAAKAAAKVPPQT